MPNLPISQLPELLSSAVTENAEFAVAQGGTTYKVKLENIRPAPVVLGYFSQSGDSLVISATTIENSLIGPGTGTLSVPANQFEVGNSFRVIMGGLMSANNNDDIRIRIKGDGSVLADSGVQNLVGTSGFEVFILSVDFSIRAIGGLGVAEIVTLGNFVNYKLNNGAATGFAWNTLNNTTFDTTILNTLDITAQWSQSSANNIIYSDIMTLRQLF